LLHPISSSDKAARKVDLVYATWQSDVAFSRALGARLRG